MPFAPIEMTGAMWIRTGRPHPASLTVSVEPTSKTFDVREFVSSVIHGTVLYSSAQSAESGAWYCLISAASPNGALIIEQQAWEIEGSLVVITATCLASEFADLRHETSELLAKPEPVGDFVEVNS